MNIKIERCNDISAVTGGGYAVQDVVIYIDDKIDKHLQVETVIHEILEVYLPLEHTKIEELTSLLTDGQTN